MRVPSVALLAALTFVAHAAPGQNSPLTLPPTPEIVRMFSEPAASVEQVDISDSLEDGSDEANYQAKRSYEQPSPPKQFCIEIRPKNPSQSPFVICEPPTQPYYPQPPPQIPYPYHPDPPAYPPGPSAYPPPSAPPHQPGGKPYQRSNAMGFNADGGMMMMMPLMGGLRNAEAAAAPPPPMQFPQMSNPSAIAPVVQPSPGPVMMQPMPPQASGRSTYPQPYGTYDQTPPVTMQCHTPPGYQSYHGYQNPVALLQLFLKPSHHHHHHPSYNYASTEAPSYRAAADESSTPKPKQTTSTPLNKTHASASDNSTEGPLRIPIPIDAVTTGTAQAPQVFKGPHITPDGSHPDTKKIPGITTSGRPNPVFQPGGGAALLKPVNTSAPKMAEGGAEDIAVNMVDGPQPMGRSGGAPTFAAPHEAWAAYRSLGGNDMIMPENHIIPGHMFMPTDSNLPNQ